MELKAISQILVYSTTNHTKNLALAMVNIYGELDKESNNLYLYDNNMNYIGVIDLKCPNTIYNYTWK